MNEILHLEKSGRNKFFPLGEEIIFPHSPKKRGKIIFRKKMEQFAPNEERFRRQQYDQILRNVEPSLWVNTAVKSDNYDFLFYVLHEIGGIPRKEDLALAIRRRQPQLAELLLEKNLPLELYGGWPAAPRHYYTDVIDAAIENIRETKSKFSQPTKFGRKAVEDDLAQDLAILEWLLKGGFFFTVPVLEEAARKNDLDIVQKLWAHIDPPERRIQPLVLNMPWHTAAAEWLLATIAKSEMTQFEIQNLGDPDCRRNEQNVVVDHITLIPIEVGRLITLVENGVRYCYDIVSLLRAQKGGYADDGTILMRWVNPATGISLPEKYIHLLQLYRYDHKYVVNIKNRQISFDVDCYDTLADLMFKLAGIGRLYPEAVKLSNIFYYAPIFIPRGGGDVMSIYQFNLTMEVEGLKNYKFDERLNVELREVASDPFLAEECYTRWVEYCIAIQDRADIWQLIPDIYKRKGPAIVEKPKKLDREEMEQLLLQKPTARQFLDLVQARDLKISAGQANDIARNLIGLSNEVQKKQWERMSAGFQIDEAIKNKLFLLSVIYSRVWNKYDLAGSGYIGEKYLRNKHQLPDYSVIVAKHTPLPVKEM